MLGIIKWHLRQRRWFIFWWILALVGFVGLNLAFYSSFKDQASQLEQSLGQLPEAVMSFLSDTGDFFSPAGYLSSQVFYLMLPMLLSIMSIILGSSLIATEEKEGTIELLLARPVSRAKLLISKAMSGVIILFFVGTICLVAITIICSIVGIEIPLYRIALTTALTITFALTTGAVAFTLSALGGFGRAMSVGVATLIALGGYVLSSLIGVVSWLEWPAKLFPFYYYRPASILNGDYAWRNIWYFVILLSMSGFLSILFFRRRDIS